MTQKQEKTALAVVPQGGGQQRVVAQKQKPFVLVPKNFEQATQLAQVIADSDLAPKDYKGKAGNVLVAMQMGAEVGLSPMQSVQNIAVINGRPSVWGDAAIALCLQDKNNEVFEDTMGNIKRLRERWASEEYVPASKLVLFVLATIDPLLSDNTAVCAAVCGSRAPKLHTFTQQMAKTANLWGKAGPWTQYPERMLQMRARGFCLRDVFPHIMKGLNVAEEVEDYEIAPGVSVIAPAKPQGLQPGKFGFTVKASEKLEAAKPAAVEPAPAVDDGLAEKRKAALAFWAKHGVDESRVLASLGAVSVQELNARDVDELRERAVLVKSGTAIDDCFPSVEDDGEDVVEDENTGELGGAA